MECNSPMKVLFLIVNAGYVDEVVEIMREAGIRGATILNARGAGARHENFMGITVDSEKEIILCVVDNDTCENVLAVVSDKAGIKTPAHGVGFTLPVEKVIGIHTAGKA